MRRFLLELTTVLLVSSSACEVASSQSAVTAWLRVAGAQRVEGPPPVESSATPGPQVTTVALLGARIWPGQLDKPLAGSLEQGATAVSLFLVGDRAHYVLPAGAPDVTAPTQPTFLAHLSFSPSLVLGPHELWLQATNSLGQYGPPSIQKLLSDEEPPAQGALVVVLRWQRAADLDLHVEQPDGQEIWTRRKSGNTTEAPGRPPMGSGSGFLDVDSNALCVIDGRQREQVIYPRAAALGRYRIRVDTFSLCGQASAYWQASALVDGVQVASAMGQSLPTDTRGEHGLGAGTLALEVELR
jgi:hypothetical protein